MNENDIKKMLEADMPADDIVHEFINLVNRVQAEDERAAAKVELEKALKNYLATFSFWPLISKGDQNQIIAAFYPTLEESINNLKDLL